MHIHILGICGTFMGGLAVLAQQAGHKVTGCDANVYPPMSTQLRAQGIELIEGYGPEQVELAPDLYVIGNVISRGNPLMETILNRGLPYVSGPAWMGEHILQGKWVLAVAGTHGKTTTSAMLAWILQEAGYAPGFLIGGVPLNFGISARLGGSVAPAATDRSVSVLSATDHPEASSFFVIEADEYDSAFFDKRSKFVHYHARTAILNNLEYDHADIFPDLTAIETQFHHLVRTVPGIGRVIVNGKEPALQRVMARGCWSEQALFGVPQGWCFSGDEVQHDGNVLGRLTWQLQGEHNRQNALAAIAAAHHVGVLPAVALEALSRFDNVKRRMEVCGVVNAITVIDDFAHHPTAIATTVAGLRASLDAADDNAGVTADASGDGSAAKGASAHRRILAVLEPRSNTMKLGSMKAALPGSLAAADLVFAYGASSGRDALGWSLSEALAPLGERARSFDDLTALTSAVVAQARAGDVILAMSNGGFGGIHQKILDALALAMQVVAAVPVQTLVQSATLQSATLQAAT